VAHFFYRSLAVHSNQRLIGQPVALFIQDLETVDFLAMGRAIGTTHHLKKTDIAHISTEAMKHDPSGSPGRLPIEHLAVRWAENNPTSQQQ
jgi:hypothetical protein